MLGAYDVNLATHAQNNCLQAKLTTDRQQLIRRMPTTAAAQTYQLDNDNHAVDSDPSFNINKFWIK